MFLTIAKEEIQLLNDEQARELVARLCQAEVLKNGYDTSLVTWGGDQRAPDGGVDVRVNFPVNSKHRSDWLKRKEKVAIQVKAVKSFAVSDIKKEMGSDNHIPMLQSLSDSGSYIIISTKSSTADSSLEKNLTAMKDALAEFSISNVETDFYDARRVADWVNEHPAVFVWVKKELGQPISGWKPYGAWAYHESDMTAEYILDDKAKLITPSSEAVSILGGINILRQALRQSEPVRLVGLSGVGKTRLVQALFDERIETEAFCSEKECVIYADISDALEPQPQLMLESILEKKSRSILIVDNCGSELHGKLVELLKKSGNQGVSLLTIEYDIREDLPDHTVCYRLESSSDKVIERFISNRFSLLSHLDVQKIVEFSDGNARVAYALANTAQESGELAQLKNNELFNRLFHQKHDPNNRDLLITAKYASLVYSFNSDNEELESLANLSGQSVRDFRLNLAELARRGLLQSRGCWRAVLPHAIANNLAKLVLEDLSSSELSSIFTHENKRFVRSFSRRLGYLHESKVAQDLVKNLLAPSGKLYLLESLSDDEKVMVTNLAPVALDAMLCCLESAVKRPAFLSDADDFGQWKTTLLHLAYDAELFNRVLTLLVLLSFSSTTVQTKKNEFSDITGLFSFVLSGTEAMPEARLAAIQSLIDNQESNKVALGFACLKTALHYGHFTSSFWSFDFGARSRTYGWEPKDQSDYVRWYVPLLDYLSQLIRDDRHSEMAIDLLIDCFYELYQLQIIRNKVLEIADSLDTSSHFSSLLSVLKHTLHWRKDQLTELEKNALMALINKLSPQTEIDALRYLLCVKNRHFYDDEGERLNYENIHNEIVNKGKVFANRNDWYDLIPCMLSDDVSYHIHYFGWGLGQAHNNPMDLLGVVLRKAEEARNESVNLDTRIVDGILRGWNEKTPEALDEFLESIHEDSVWSSYFIRWQLDVKPYDTDKAYERLLKKAEAATDSHELMAFKGLGNGCRLQDYSTEQLLALSRAIMSKPSGLGVVLDVWYMAVYCAKDKDADYQSELKLSAQHLLEQLNWSAIENGNDGHHLLDVMDYAYHDLGANEQIENTIQHFVEHMMVSDWIEFSALPNCLFYFMERFPQATLDHLYAQQTHENFKRVISTLTSGFVRQERSFNYDVEVIMNWCQGEHQKLMLIASMFRLFKIKGDTFVEEDSSLIEPVALALLRAASMHRDVLEKVFESFSPNHWSGSRANIMEKRMQLFDGVDLSSHPELCHFWLEQRGKILESINFERQREQERHRHESETFE